MNYIKTFHWKDRFKASSIHLGLSLALAALAGLLVFALWYPYPYRDSSGGRELFLIVITVDVILGPLITLAVFNRYKPRGELVRDLTVIGLIQMAALVYGLWTVFIARPVHLTFEYDRFRVVHAIDVQDESLNQAPPEMRKLPLAGPALLALRPFVDENEKSTATMMALQGTALSAQPQLWQAYPDARSRVLSVAKPMSELRQRFPQQQLLIDQAVHKTGQRDDKLAYLPMVERRSFWTVLLDAETAEVRGFIELDPF